MASPSFMRRGVGDKADGYASIRDDGPTLLPTAPAATTPTTTTTTKRKHHQVRVQGRLVLVRSVSAVNLAIAPGSATPTAVPDVPPLPSPAPSAGQRPSPTAWHDPGVGGAVGGGSGSSGKSRKKSGGANAPGRQRRHRHSTAATAAATATGRRHSWGPHAPSSTGAFGVGGGRHAHDGTSEASDENAYNSAEDYGHYGDDGDSFDNDNGSDDNGDHSGEARETARRDRQRRGYGIGGAGNIRRPTEVVHFYSTSNRTVGSPAGSSSGRRRWQWMSSLLGLRGKREGTASGLGGVGSSGVAVRRVDDDRYESS